MADPERDTAARQRAQAMWGEKKKEIDKAIQERDKARLADAEKTARLRQLRLAKEAEERKAAEAQAPVRRKPRA
ncbi:MAG TPA: hypothetical protein VK433_00345 [Stellaceae bacterium]|nr:hypothetical protein [Stellaceae bacterium]